MIQQYLQVGTILSTHALKGEVKVFPTTDDIRRFDSLKEVLVSDKADGSGVSLKVERVRYFKNLVILKFRGIDRIEDVQKYLKKDLYIPRADAIPLQDDEYFVGDLFGLDVISADDGSLIGTVTDVLATGANDVYVVNPKDDPKKEILIPAIKDCIREVDLENGTMTVHLLGGMM